MSAGQDQPAVQVRVTVAERRDSHRHRCTLPSVCYPVPPGSAAEWMASILDISESGLALVMNRRFERGAVLGLELGNGGELLLATVVRTDQRPDGTWLLGCTFPAGRLIPEQIARLTGAAS